MLKTGILFVQFLYGEDGLDVCKSQYLKPKQMTFLDVNSESIINKPMLKQIHKLGDLKKVGQEKAEVFISMHIKCRHVYISSMFL